MPVLIRVSSILTEPLVDKPELIPGILARLQLNVQLIFVGRLLLGVKLNTDPLQISAGIVLFNSLGCGVTTILKDCGTPAQPL